MEKMPVYEYKCKRCGKEFEWSQRITDEPLKTCPPEICENAQKGLAGDVERKISKNVGFAFHGNGFYLTDYVFKNGNSNGSSKSKATSKSK